MRRSHAALVAVGTGAGTLIAAALVWQASNGSFTATTSNGPSQWSAGQVTLTTGSGSALFALASTMLKPTDTGSACITVTYSGNVLAKVKLYENAQSGSLAPWLQMTVVRADGSGAANCSDFAGLANPSTLATTTDLTTLNSSSGTYANGLGLWTASTSTTKTYKFTYVVNAAADNTVQNTTAAATFTWEAQT